MTGLVFYLVVFVGVGVFFLFFHLVLGRLVRPVKPDPDKMTIYECGEPTIGSAWIQFDLRYYVVALLFVIFDVEVVFFFPWAVVFGSANTVKNNVQPLEQQVEAFAALTVTSPAQQAQAKRWRKELAEGTTAGREKVAGELAEARAPASGLAWVALWDILVFFGVLLVGFAYLWKRGDIDWVRSVAAERAATARPVGPRAPEGEAALAGAARGGV
jgi:NADH-quinone oxidoreductase subunit A